MSGDGSAQNEGMPNFQLQLSTDNERLSCRKGTTDDSDLSTFTLMSTRTDVTFPGSSIPPS